MDAKLLHAVRTRMESSPTDELLRLWTDNDREHYSEEAFEAARLILTNRDVVLPPQRAWPGSVPIARKAKAPTRYSEGGWQEWLVPIFWIGIVQGGIGTASAILEVLSALPEGNWGGGFWVFGSIGGIAFGTQALLQGVLPIVLFVGALGCLYRNPRFRIVMLAWACGELARLGIFLISIVISSFYEERAALHLLYGLVFRLYNVTIPAAFPTLILFILSRPHVKQLFQQPVQGFDVTALSGGTHIAHE